MVTEARKKATLFFRDLGPGLITGAADDDPSGISTYSVAGAAYGAALLWTVLLTFPLMAAVQTMCARLALVTGEGLAATIRRRYPTWVLVIACLLLFVANVVNIGADLAGMAESMSILIPLPKALWLVGFAFSIVLSLVFWSYKHLARVFKWLTVTLFAYVFAAFLARPDWDQVLRSTFIPSIAVDRDFLMMLAAILGTTITPYMFFWQAAQEVEEEKTHGHRSLQARRGATPEELRAANRDVLVGMGWAGLAMYFIILTTASTLHPQGITQISSAKEAAEALRPLAGDSAYLLFTIGLVGTGMLAIPVLAGSAAYAMAEAFHFQGSLDDKPKVGRKFYGVIILAIGIGLLLDFVNIDAVKALFYAAVVNGVLAPPLVAIVCALSGDRRVMGEQRPGRWTLAVGWIAAALMALVAVAIPFSS
ncbi:MAG: Nramp family divalent metal transporter [Fimbriimonadaceae bacterium]|nr:Nramp family divalent metal transporter [Fimbriimonadaceae bacterium]